MLQSPAERLLRLLVECREPPDGRVEVAVDDRLPGGVFREPCTANPDFQVSLVRYLAGTYDEFRKESIG